MLNPVSLKSQLAAAMISLVLCATGGYAGGAGSLRHLQDAECPPADYAPKSSFDAAEYISKPWYSLKQLPVTFQGTNTFSCTRAKYTEITGKDFLCIISFSCNKLRITVENQSRTGGVGGTVNNAQLYAVNEDPAIPSQLTVTPSFLPTWLFGPNYWVLDAGTYSDLLGEERDPESTEYEWALISGGPAGTASNGKCITGAGPLNNNGFWYFSSQPVPPTGVIEKLDEKAESYGIDISVLLPVTQEGCVYD
eukprot:CAMPEP_0183720716 /NCGR_PEP_ID=MMETSP0737-20130205/13250_1 /TAXON_ID=385413 /ORGANISM="Thalassiosira miniscula, Strain CCMP1093" /LENGTH=250 /DNA_ID=CAMNT_0025950631 /DNA_START=42 /DNA_END=794 /DNA_ORIENTATION=-